jgi:hypothetical protein
MFCFFAFFILSTGCGDDKDTPEGCATNFAATFQDELEDINTASANFSNDPSTANCEAFKDAYNDYLDALEDWEECANINNQVVEWQQSLDAARAAINDLVC